MSYVVLARKYRPMRFADMVGQEHIGRTLGNAIKQDRVHHAYLFSGARGLGKTTTARIFAKGLVCEQGPTPEPCNQCSQCVAVSEGRSVDVMEIDGASNNSVDNIRNLREQVNYLPQTARRKVYIIDEVHMLTTSAFNALLKTLEEPPPHVNFVFATTEPQKVLPTILSRVNRLDFKRVAPGTLVGYLRSILDQEGLSVQEGGLRIVARAGEGSVRDALTLLDQVIAFAEDPSNVGEDEVRRLLGQADAGAVLELLAAILRRDPAQTMRRFDALVTAGNDLSVLCLQVLEHLRDLALVKVCDTPEVLPDATEAELEQRRALVADVSSTHLGQLFDRFSRVIDRLPQSRTQRLLVEMGLLDLACAEPVMPLGDLVDQLHALGRGAPPPTGGGGGRGAPRASGGRGRPAGAGMHAGASA
ncbi:MAG: DNA polymerase III subunit gamma/tau, partial [Myxococcales bacterium]|nr:DNA polymerase III subunit gamma/tau [Myxococcales bacterium]